MRTQRRTTRRTRALLWTGVTMAVLSSALQGPVPTDSPFNAASATLQTSVVQGVADTDVTGTAPHMSAVAAVTANLQQVVTTAQETTTVANVSPGASVDSVDLSAPVVPEPVNPEDCEIIQRGYTLGERVVVHGRPGEAQTVAIENGFRNANIIRAGQEICYRRAVPLPLPPEESEQRFDTVAFEQSTEAAAPVVQAVSLSDRDSRIQQVIDYAMGQRGDPYEWGATGPGSFDCSGLTMAAYASIGVDIPRHSRDQARFGTRINSIHDLQPGDIIYYHRHVTLYIGNGQEITAPRSGTVVKIANIRPDDFTNAARII